jgi:methionyl-tRNA formyltransferase
MNTETPFAFFGTPYVGRDTLALLYERGFVPKVVVTSPDRPRGRGLTMTPCETKEWALAHDLPVLAPEKIDEEAIAAIKEYGCQYAVVVAYGKILPQTLIDLFPLGLLNVHYSLLPKYRGASPVEAALLNGDTITGVAIQKLVFEMDAGDIVTSSEVAIEPNETTKELRARLIEIGGHLLADILSSFIAGTAQMHPQDHTLATRSRKIKKEEGELILSGDATTNWNKYRAYAESPGTYFFAMRDDKKLRVKIKAATFERHSFTPTLVVPEGKSEMTYADFIRAGYSPL